MMLGEEIMTAKIISLLIVILFVFLICPRLILAHLWFNEIYPAPASDDYE